MSPSLSCRVRYRLCTSLVMLVICVRCRLCTTLVALVTQEHHCIPTQQVQVTANGRCMPFGQLRQGPFRAPVLNKVVALKPVQCYGSRCKHMTVYSRAKVGFSEHKSPTSICGGLMLPHPPPPQVVCNIAGVQSRYASSSGLVTPSEKGKRTLPQLSKLMRLPYISQLPNMSYEYSIRNT